MFGSIFGNGDEIEDRFPDAIEVDEGMHETLISNYDDEGVLFKVRPFEDNEAMAAMESMLQEFHDPQSKWGFKNVSSRMAFEIWLDEDQIQFLFFAPDKHVADQLKKHIDIYFPDSNIEDISEGVGEGTTGKMFPEIYSDDYVTGVEMYLERHPYYPLKNPYGVRDFNFDPYKGVTAALQLEREKRAIIQITFQPALDTWSRGGALHWFNPLSENVEEVAEGLRNEMPIADSGGEDERKAIREETQLAERIAAQKDMDAFNVNIRIIGFSSDQMIARDIWEVARSFEQKYEEAGGQSFIREGATGRRQMKKLIKRAAGRKIIDNEMIVTIPELAAVAHIPNKSINAPRIAWNETAKGDRVPPGAEQFLDGIEEDRDTLGGGEEGKDSSGGGDGGGGESFIPQGGEVDREQQPPIEAGAGTEPEPGVEPEPESATEPPPDSADPMPGAFEPSTTENAETDGGMKEADADEDTW